MGVISTDNNEIKLYFHSESSIGKQIQAYVLASERKILTIDISKTTVTGTQWTELAKGLGVPVSGLINKEHPDFTQHYDKRVDLDADDWLKILDKNPIVLSKPIAIIGKKYVQLESPSDFIKYIEPDSKSIH
ncbi:arsenate reductase family protein [Gelidibacter mesophilus]|uniref:arsenate reductase family protein n=1 Tax=Gelidibacter mesophilus TaxID=169050 RepID=UPI000409E658|nr:arsenate reductase [Gelidibacter mesophilus]